MESQDSNNNNDNGQASNRLRVIIKGPLDQEWSFQFTLPLQNNMAGQQRWSFEFDLPSLGNTAGQQGNMPNTTPFVPPIPPTQTVNPFAGSAQQGSIWTPNPFAQRLHSEPPPARSATQRLDASLMFQGVSNDVTTVPSGFSTLAADRHRGIAATTNVETANLNAVAPSMTNQPKREDRRNSTTTSTTYARNTNRTTTQLERSAAQSTQRIYGARSISPISRRAQNNQSRHGERGAIRKTSKESKEAHGRNQSTGGPQR